MPDAGDLNIVLNAVALAAIIVAALFAFRYRSTLEALRVSGDAWREERDAEKAKAERLDMANHALEIEIAELRGKTDLSLLSTQITEASTGALIEIKSSFEHLFALLEKHEDRAVQRHESQQKVNEQQSVALLKAFETISLR